MLLVSPVARPIFLRTALRPGGIAAIADGVAAAFDGDALATAGATANGFPTLSPAARAIATATATALRGNAAANSVADALGFNAEAVANSIAQAIGVGVRAAAQLMMSYCWRAPWHADALAACVTECSVGQPADA